MRRLLSIYVCFLWFVTTILLLNGLVDLSGPLLAQIAPSKAVFSGTGLNDATSGGIANGGGENHIFVATLAATGTPDTFQWQEDGGAPSSAINIVATTPNLMADGITITFGASTGHHAGDSWTISVTVNGSVSSSTVMSPGVGGRFRGVQDVLNLEIQDYNYDTWQHADFAAASRGRTLVNTQRWTNLPTYTTLSHVRYAGGNLQSAASPAPLTITGAANPGVNLTTYTVASTATIVPGMNAFITGISPAGWNAAGTVLSVTPTTFTISQQTPAGSPYVSGGGVALQHVLSVPCPSFEDQFTIFDWSLGGSFGYTNGCRVSPSWFGSTGNDGLDDWGALTAAIASLPNNPLGRITRGGGLEKQGVILLNPAVYQVGQTLMQPPGVRLVGTGGYGAFNGSGVPGTLRNANIQLMLGVSTGLGPEYFTVAVDPDVDGGNSTYGVYIDDVTIDCQGGWHGRGFSLPGNNTSCSGYQFFGAQGSGWDNLVVRNNGYRGIVMPIATTIPTSGTWLSQTIYPLGTLIVDGSFPFHFQKVTTAGVSGSAQPGSWNHAGGTTSDGTAVWTDQGAATFSSGSGLIHPGHAEIYTAQRGPGISVESANSVNFEAELDIEGVSPSSGTWVAGTYPAGTIIIDPNGYSQYSAAGGATGTTIPTFNDTVGGTTTDGSATWVCMFSSKDSNGHLYAGLSVYSPIGSSTNIEVRKLECEGDQGACAYLAGTNVVVDQVTTRPVSPSFTPVSSTTSNTIGFGSLTFTVSSGLSFQPNDLVSIQADADDWMVGSVTSYSGTSLVVNIPTAWLKGSGTYTSWMIAGGAPEGIVIGPGSRNVSVKSFSFSTTPNLYVNMVNDLAEAIVVPGNLSSFPSSGYDQNTDNLAVRLETLTINPSGRTLMIGSAVNIVAGQYPCGGTGIVQLGGYIQGCNVAVNPTARLVMKGYDIFGFTQFDLGPPGSTNISRIATFADRLVLQGGNDNPAARPVTMISGDISSPLYGQLTVGFSGPGGSASIYGHGTATFDTYGTGIWHSSSAGLISSSAVDLASPDVTGTLPNANLVSSGQITINAGTGLSGGGAVALGGSVTLTNTATAGITALTGGASATGPGSAAATLNLTAGTGIGISGTFNGTITNTAPFPATGITHTITLPCGTAVYTNGLLTSTTGTC